ncbi:MULTISPECIES: hypothetical protein [Xanthomonas]|uniref:hypothetical protein n=1 Tax=Xanthomonas TaxID=338 RepID=UPI00168A703A|nr:MULTISPECIES: hypothetical protein [Xanthomonas]MDY4339398.1 hypothetical protein [Xanthomonas sp. LF07-6]UYK86138.1 hypothetical protein NG827_06940 [Xanthomonas sacchari]
MAFVVPGVKNFIKVLPFFALLAFSNSASASSSVTIGGTTTTCENSCVVTLTGNGGYSITDCCGGRIETVIMPRTKPGA